jgi:hypothetical protein
VSLQPRHGLRVPYTVVMGMRRALCGLLAASGCFVDSGMPVAGADETGESSAQTIGSAVSESSVTADASGSTTGTVSAGSIGDSQTATGMPTSGPQTEDSGTTGTSESVDASTSSSLSSTGFDASSSTTDGIFGVDELLAGDLVITEVMGNPNCSPENCEWFELYNASALTFDLEGLAVGDENFDDLNLGQVVDSVIIEPGAYVVLGRQVVGWPYAFEADGLYGPDPALSNGSPEVVRIATPAGVVLDETPFFFDGEAGRSFSLRPEFLSADDNDEGLNWCYADTPLPHDGVGDEWGTPQAPNDACAP